MRRPPDGEPQPEIAIGSHKCEVKRWGEIGHTTYVHTSRASLQQAPESGPLCIGGSIGLRNLSPTCSGRTLRCKRDVGLVVVRGGGGHSLSTFGHKCFFAAVFPPSAKGLSTPKEEDVIAEVKEHA